MEESIFEWMERTKFVDTLLLVLAFATPLAVAVLFALFRGRTFVADYLNRWAIAFVAMPLVLLLWHIFNRIVDHYGLDSVFGLFLNAGVFAVTAAILLVLDVVLVKLLYPSRS
jgi:Fe2+ transport system protein B